jgi:hypothetical protein
MPLVSDTGAALKNFTMNKATKLFQILEIDNNVASIAVTITGGKLITISAADFKSFLMRHDRLDYCSDSELMGEHIQFAGTLSFEEYMEGEKKYIEQDLYDYIICKKIDWKLSRAVDCLESICKEYNDNRFANLQPINL